MITHARSEDLPDIMALAIEALYQENENLGLTIDRNRVYKVATRLVCHQSNLFLLAWEGSRLVGGLGALVVPQAFYEGQYAKIIMWYSNAPGHGMPLMRRCLEWFENKDLTMLEYSLPQRNQQRMARLVQRLGLTTAVPTYCQMR